MAEVLLLKDALQNLLRLWGGEGGRELLEENHLAAGMTTKRPGLEMPTGRRPLSTF